MSGFVRSCFGRIYEGAPCRAAFVADVAQFAPKTVGTEEERQKLCFGSGRNRAGTAVEHITQAETCLPGMGYVRVDPQAVWPPELQARAQR